MKRSRLVLAGAVAAIALGAAAAPSTGSTVTVGSAAQAAVQAAPAAALAPAITPNGSIPAGCRYPSTRTPTITFAATPSTFTGNQTFTLSGTLFLNTCQMSNWPVYIYVNNRPTGTFSYYGGATTNSAGVYSLSGQRLAGTGTRYFVVVSASRNNVSLAQSAVVSVTRR